MPRLPHFIITRLGLCVYDPAALRESLELFEAVTLPSLLHQSDQDFTCLVVTDSQMPPAERCRLEALVAPYPLFDIVVIDVTTLIHVRQGCFDWVWARCQDHLLASGVVRDPAQYTVTSILDADDAWHVDVAKRVNQFMAEKCDQLCSADDDRGTWLQHTRGIAATFRRGYRWFIANDTWQSMDQPFMSMAVFVAARFSSGISACSSRHLAWPAYCEVLAFESLTIKQDTPMWAWVRHAGATQPWKEGRGFGSRKTAGPDRYSAFGLDRAAVARWRARHAIDGARRPCTSHPGRSASAQFDRVFQIAGLNRQIRALAARRSAVSDRSPAEIDAIEDLIARAHERRNHLVDLLREVPVTP